MWQFNEDGTNALCYTVDTLELEGKTPLVLGTYVFDGNLYTETSAAITSAAYPACDSPATYAWTHDGQTLEFQLVGEDPCSDRQRTYESPLEYTRAE